MAAQKMKWREKIDFLSLMDSRTFEIENKCESSTLYKYYNFSDQTVLANFLERPTIKFATKTQLNDPFDISRRWQAFGSAPTRSFLAKYLAERLEAELSDKSAVVRRMMSDPRFKSSRLSVPQLYKAITSAPGQAFITELRAAMLQELPLMIEAAFEAASTSIDTDIADAFKSIGLLSLTEDPSNRAMWGLYAGSGDGFALEFNAQHDFFMVDRANGTRRNRLLRVLYTDERWDDFWQNPLSLFAVKNTEFSFEREWRMIHDTKACHRVETTLGPLFLRDAPKGLIRRIIFGHRVTTAEAVTNFASIAKFDRDIDAVVAVPNMVTGDFELLPLR